MVKSLGTGFDQVCGEDRLEKLDNIFRWKLVQLLTVHFSWTEEILSIAAM